MRCRAAEAVVAGVVLGFATAGLPAQLPPAPAELLARAFDHEDAGRLDSAAAGFRRVLKTPERQQALLGLERVFAMQGRRRDAAALADTVLGAVPDDPIALGVKVRALTALEDRATLWATVQGWAVREPREAAPWREASRALLEAGFAAAADSMAEAGVQALGGVAGVAIELGQARVRLGRWEDAARAFRDALRESAWLEESVVYALRSTPADRRATTTAAMLQLPTPMSARSAVGSLRAGWGDAAGAWQALRALPKRDSSVVRWRAFAATARRLGAPAEALEALVSALEVARTPQDALDAAEAALEARVPATALDLTEVAAAAPGGDSSAISVRRAVVRTRALAALGKLSEAARTVAGLADPLARRRAAAALAEGYALAGDLAQAALVADTEHLSAEDDPAAAWVAVWRGDFATARTGLAALGQGARPAAQAMALISRTRAAQAPVAGSALLALARGDTLGAMDALQRAVAELPEVAQVLRLEAARLAVARRDDPLASRLWAAIVAADVASPEAAEARLARARAAIRRGEQTSAREDLEALILEQPQSALVPQARRELERLAGRVP
jgi:tetratricopeptide (TPR) repeat protein